MLSVNKNIEIIKSIINNESEYLNEIVPKHMDFKTNNITVLIPTHNRHEYLQRSIDYYRLFDFIQVIYVDSSELKFRFSENEDANIEYIHLKGYSFIDKMIYALDKIQTKYVCTCADDDFLLISELLNGLNLLSKNDNYVLYYGGSVSFKNNNMGLEMFRSNKRKERNIVGDRKYRAFKFFSKYVNVLWSLAKREELIKAFNILKEADFNNHNYYEITLGTTFSNNGDIFITDKTWLLRESIDGSWGEQHKSLLRLRKDKLEKKDYDTYKKLTKKYYGKNYGEYAFSVYFVFGYIVKVKNLRYLTPARIKRKIKQFINSY